jgi:hypothetical protein
MNNKISSTSDCSDTAFSPILNKVAVKIWEISVNNSSGIVFNWVLEKITFVLPNFKPVALKTLVLSAKLKNKGLKSLPRNFDLFLW